MYDRMGNVLGAWVLIGACLLLTACGSSAPDPQPGEPDGGTVVPDGGPGDEQPSTCAVPAPTSCPEPAPRYAEVAPIFERRCTGCHAGNPGGPWSLKDYGHVADWQDTIRAAMRDCSMPPEDAGVTMTVEERVAILTWIRCGLPR